MDHISKALNISRYKLLLTRQDWIIQKIKQAKKNRTLSIEQKTEFIRLLKQISDDMARINQYSLLSLQRTNLQIIDRQIEKLKNSLEDLTYTPTQK